MGTPDFRPPNPAGGYHKVATTRRFRYLAQDPAHTLRITWITQDLACPACAVDTGLLLVLDEPAGDGMVQVTCPVGHQWADPRVDRHHFAAYSRLNGFVTPDPDWFWVVDAGFGEEPPPPIDVAHDIAGAAKYVAKRVKSTAKAKVKGEVRKETRKARRAAAKAAKSPFTAARRAWSKKAGPATEPQGKEPYPDIPSVAKYRKAYGMPAPKRGPRCLVCEDTGRIPGTPITCTECAGPAAAATAAAEKRADRARQGKDRRPASAAQGPGLVNTGTVTGPVQVAPSSVNDPRVKKAKAQAAKAATKATDTAAKAPRSGVTLNGRHLPEGRSVDARGNEIYVNTGVVNTGRIEGGDQERPRGTRPKKPKPTTD
jgi:hypothetical protein